MTLTQSRLATIFILLSVSVNMYYASSHLNAVLSILTAGCAVVSELYYNWYKIK